MFARYFTVKEQEIIDYRGALDRERRRHDAIQKERDVENDEANQELLSGNESALRG